MESLPAVIIALILPKSYLISSVLYLLVIFVFVLIGPGVLMGMIARNRNIMREYSSSGIREMAYWSSLIFVPIFGIIAII